MSCVIQNTKGCTIYELRTSCCLIRLLLSLLLLLLLLIIIIRKTERGEQRSYKAFFVIALIFHINQERIIPFCRASRPVSRLESRAWSLAWLGRLARRTKKTERLLVVYIMA